MNRREFAQVTGLLLPLSMGVRPARADDEPRPSAVPRYAFYDARFPRALKFALRVGAGDSWRAMDGDAAAAWLHVLRPALIREPLVATGITTPSVPFCLEILARERAVVRMTQRRVDHDLIHWTLEAKAHG
jgi:hypothetical protein